MKYQYPKINNWLVFGPRKNETCQVLDCLNDESYSFGSEIARFAKKLDGSTDPYSIFPSLPRRTVTEMLRELDRCGLLRRSRILSSSLNGLDISLWTTAPDRRQSGLPRILNALLLLTFLPLFLGGCLTFFCPNAGADGRRRDAWGDPRAACGAFPA